jgi:RNA polymerase sigma factor (sigma-70 family)
MSAVMSHLRQLVGGWPAQNVGDAQLLDRFVRGRDEVALEALVRRHGRLVWGVCRRVLSDGPDAEDAFQATFLVLVRRAGAIRKSDSVASWLYGVAYRVAVRARGAIRRRQYHERQAAGGGVAMAVAKTEPGWQDLRPVLDEELSRLPAKYSEPVALCYLEGLTNEEAARRLGWTKGTVSGRLARARELLRARLARRGLALSGVALAALITENAAAAAVPATVFHATLEAALAGAAGTAAAGASPAAAALAEGVLQHMTTCSLRRIGLSLIAALGLLAGAGAWVASAGSDETGTAGAPGGGAAAQGKEPGKDAGKGRKSDLEGTWVVVAAERAGQQAPERELENLKLLRVIFTGDKFIIKGAPEEMVANYKADRSTKPQHIEMTWDGGNQKGKVMRGAFAIEGGQLKLVLAEGEGEGFPTELATKAGSSHMMLTLRRANKDEEKPSPEAIAKIKAATDRMRSQNNLKQIALAMHNYLATSGDRFPAHAIYSKDGKPLLSWRVAILPFIEEDHLYKQFKLDEPWDSEHNKKLLARMPKVYAPVNDRKTKEPNMTFYQVVVGTGTVFSPQGKGMRIVEITDGTSNTLLVAEAAEAVPWTKPEDLSFNGKTPPKVGGLFDDIFNVALCDGSVRSLPKKVDPEMFKALITAQGGEVIDYDKLHKAGQ